MKPLRATVLSLAAIALAIPHAALAWGPDGHRAVAEVAAALLTGATRAKVARLLGGDDATAAMVTATSWATEPRAPAAAADQSVGIPLIAETYDHDRDCPDDTCAVAQLDRQTRILADPTQATAARRQALRAVITLVADLHQPLNATDHHDHGGTDVKVVIDGRDDTLHGFWDNGAVAAIAPDAEAVASLLASDITPGKVAEWSRGGPVEWVNESHRVGQLVAYDGVGINGGTSQPGQPIVLSRYYRTVAATTARRQLGEAAVRLAAVLNRSLGEAP